jgi:CspA family cold shock protein
VGVGSPHIVAAGQDLARLLNSPGGARLTGFIEPSDGGKDIFVHISSLERAGLSSLKEGQKLKFEIARERGKDSAAHD